MAQRKIHSQFLSTFRLRIVLINAEARLRFRVFMIIVSGVCKPSSVLDDHLSGPAVASRLKRLPGSATGRRRNEGPKADAHASLSILHQVGFTARTSRQAAGELLPRLSTLASPRGDSRYISVALSLKSPSPAVNRHPALWCSDFPQARSAPAIVWRPHNHHPSDCCPTACAVIRPRRRVCGRSCRTPRCDPRCGCPAASRWAAT